MPSQVLTNVENNFTKGLITEFTGLNFPENAATDCDNVEFTLVGDVNRRVGVDYEENFTLTPIDRTGLAISTYKWDNVGGDGETQMVVEQVGTTLRFYRADNTTTASPLSAHLVGSTVDISDFLADGSAENPGLVECQYSNGNGYLFVFNQFCDPFFCTYEAGAVTATIIPIQTRDFSGVYEAGVAYNLRPTTLTQEHTYNLLNQGWSSTDLWQASSTTFNLYGVTPGTVEAYDVGSAILPISPGDVVNIQAIGYPYYTGTIVQSMQVATYVGNIIRGPIIANNIARSFSWSNWSLTPISTGNISTWRTTTNNYPSNADVWWNYKNSSGVFSPSTTYQNVTISLGPAPKGHFILNAFNQAKSSVSGVTGISSVTTSTRPTTGTWFQGRVWYAGVNASQAATGDAIHYSWTENIYFSQIVVDTPQFGLCYQKNDPTSQTLFDLLPTDGGVITIQGCGAIFKLFAIQNGLLVFAANGIWFITGSQGIGFTANDYTITKISSVRALSSTSFVDVQGLPIFWNEESIYSIEVNTQSASSSGGGSLVVNPITVGTILEFYNEIPLQSKRYARGAYHPIDYTIRWLYRSTDETDVTSRYTYNRMLNLNTHNKAFYPFSITTTSVPNINSIVYVATPGGSTTPTSKFMYVSSIANGATYNFTFSEDRDAAYADWARAGVSTNYDSYFITGYKLHGQGQRRFQMPYVYIYSRNDVPTSYKIQGLWDYASTGDSGRWSTAQLVNNWSPNFGMIFRRHRIRGQGLVLQIKVTSSDGQPFDIMGWSAFESQNTGI